MDRSCDRNEFQDLLFEALRNRLTTSGDLNKIKSELRAMVLNDVRDGDKSPMNSLGSSDSKSPSQIANHLVMEYLEWIGFQYTADMLNTESGTEGGVGGVSSRGFVEANAKLKEKDYDKELPLLLTLVMKLMKENQTE